MEGAHCNTKRAVCQESVCTHPGPLHPDPRETSASTPAVPAAAQHAPNRPGVHGSAVVPAAAKTWVFQALLSACAQHTLHH